ncbi:MAG: hypothetical protein Q9190_002453 [Brigantiaea leucoxantha]
MAPQQQGSGRELSKSLSDGHSQMEIPSRSPTSISSACTSSRSGSLLSPSSPDYDFQDPTDSDGSFYAYSLTPWTTWRRRNARHSFVYGIEDQDTLSELQDAEYPIKGRHPLKRAHSSMFGILAPSATFGSIDLTRFGGHRGTFAMLTLPREHDSWDFPVEVFARIASYIDFETYRALRLSCRQWSAAITHIRPLRFPVVYRIPAEIVKRIFLHLSLVDFNAARHSCRAWMVYSLEYRLLALRLKRHGWWTAAQADTAVNEQLGHPIGGEWRLSKRIATECSLRPGWTGSGFIESLDVPSIFQLHPFNSPSITQQQSRTGLVLNGEIDFTSLAIGIDQKNPTPSWKSRFEVSHCGRFLFVVKEYLIHIYTLYNHRQAPLSQKHRCHLGFLTSIQCPYSVLAVSMDSSSGRYSVAVLMKDRMGLIFDVPDLDAMAKLSDSGSPHSERDTRNVTPDWDIKSSPTATPTTSQRPPKEPIYTDMYHTLPDSKSPTTSLSSPVPVQFIPHTFYRNLCSKSAPPISVTICPHRRCVAFGSLRGVELHWVDANTGSELSRWFQLAGPAESIHFLDLRPEEDDTRQLRMICSRTRPPIRNSICCAWNVDSCRFVGGMPLSDGHHVLYIDPVIKTLCLGTGLRHGFGSRKPVKVAEMVQPSACKCVDESEDCENFQLPSVYKVSAELRWGARIVAAFGEKVWLFCVPPDLLVEPPLEEDDSAVEIERYFESGPAIIRGVEIGSMDAKIRDLTIDASGGNLTVYAFSANGTARVWQLCARYPKRRENQNLIVQIDGRIMDPEMREEGATFMYEIAFRKSPLKEGGESDEEGYFYAEEEEAGVEGEVQGEEEAQPEEEGGFWDGDNDMEWKHPQGVIEEEWWNVYELSRLEVEVLSGG